MAVDDGDIAVEPNYEESGDGKTAFAEINKLYDMARQFQKDVDAAETELSASKARLAMIVEDQLPKIMGEYGVKSFVAADGTEVEVYQHLENSIPAARKREAVQWLIDNQHGDVVKSEVAVTFPVKERDKAMKLMAELAVTYGGSVGIAEWVEPSTIKSILRSRLADGLMVPMALFGARAVEKAKFTEPKKSRDVL